MQLNFNPCIYNFMSVGPEAHHSSFDDEKTHGLYMHGLKLGFIEAPP